MSAKLQIIKEMKVERAKVALQKVRSLRQARSVNGVDGICQHIQNVDGDWLENWTEAENTPVSDFLNTLDTSC